MAQYTRFEIAQPPEEHWAHNGIDGVASTSPDLLVLLNQDGTETRLISSAGDLTFDPAADTLTGTVDGLTRTNSGGAIVYEAITDFSVPASTIYTGLIRTMIETALSGDDVMMGSSGPDDLSLRLLNNAGDDIVDGGRGGDNMRAGEGDDIYILRAGEGGTSQQPDRITEGSGDGLDTVRIIGLSPADVRLLTTPSGVDTGIRLALKGPDGSFTYADLPGFGFGGINAGNIERVVFDDGTIWDLTGALTIVGTGGADNMWGTPFGDNYSGAGGNDRITVRDGDDLVSGGPGNDWIEGGIGNDTLNGDEGIDVLIGGPGDDILDGGPDSDYAEGGEGDDTFILRPGEGGGREPHASEELAEYLGEGKDTIRIVGATPDDVRIIYADPSRFGMQTIALRAEDGSFTYHDLVAATNAAGSDIAQRFETVVFDDGTIWDLTSGLPATGLDGDDRMVGTPAGDRLSGIGGNDTLEGYDGNDILDGGTGADGMRGGLGDDTYLLRAGEGAGGGEFEFIHENPGEGTDTIRIVGLSPDDVRIFGPGYGYQQFVLTGPDGSVTTTHVYGPNYGAGSEIGQAIERVVFDDGTVWDLTGALRLGGTDGSDAIWGTPFADTLTGLGGDDTLMGFDGNDLIDGGAGGDLLEGGRGNDVLYGGDGNDMLKGGDGDDKMSGAADADTMLGGDGNDWLSGGEGNDILDGGAGADTMSGGGGDDIYHVDHSGDIVIEGKDGGIDEIRSSVSFTLGSYAEHLVLEGEVNGIGNKFDNHITGSAEANILNGMHGHDRLEGGAGDDTLTGGRDGDTFVFKPGFGHDVITDFTGWGPDHDIIAFDRSIFANTASLFAQAIPYFDGVMIETDAGDSLIIENVTLDQLKAHPEDFFFV